jgi:hypothetical protein
MDREAVTAIYVEKVPETGIGKAIMNRLYRAEAASVNPDGRARPPSGLGG